MKRHLFAQTNLTRPRRTTLRSTGEKAIQIISTHIDGIDLVYACQVAQDFLAASLGDLLQPLLVAMQRSAKMSMLAVAYRHSTPSDVTNVCCSDSNGCVPASLCDKPQPLWQLNEYPLHAWP